MKKIITICILTILLSSCSDNSFLGRADFKKLEDSDFTEISYVKSSQLSGIKNDQLIKPNGIYIIGDFLIISETRDEKVLKVYDLKKDSYLGGFITKGMGVNEVSFPWFVSKIDDTSFVLGDGDKREFSFYKTSDLLKELPAYKKIKIDSVLLNSFIYDKQNDVCFYTGFTTENKLFYELDEKSNEIVGYETLLDTWKKKNLIEVKQHLSVNYIKYNSERKTFAFAYCYAPMIETFDYNTKKLKTLILPTDEKPKYKIGKDNGKTFVAEFSKTQYHFNDLVMTDDYIYGLYDGKTGETRKDKVNSMIYVIDYELNPVKKIILDTELYSFDIKDNFIYGLDKKTEKFPRILKYKLQ